MSSLFSLNPEIPLLPKLKCRICGHIAKDPYISECNHLFCYKCLLYLPSNQFICPSSDSKVIDRRKCKQFNNEYYVNTIVVNCADQGFGCQWVGLLKDFEEHYQSCHDP